MVDALALEAEEGRGKLRKSTGIGQHELIRTSPNGATHLIEDQVHLRVSKRRELKHLITCRKRKKNRFP